MSQTFAQLINGKSATVEFSTGSASTPSVAFSGDTNTGIYSPGADQVAISTGGTGRLFVTSSGSVGIGNGSPSYTLDVTGTHRNSGIYFNQNDTPQGTAGTITRHSVVGLTTRGITGSVFDWSVYSASGNALITNQTGTNNISFPNGNVTVTGGAVGIGTTPDKALTVSQVGGDGDGIKLIHPSRTGTWLVSHSGVSSENLGFFQNNGTSQALSYLMGRDVHYWQTGGTERARIDSAGRWLLNTSTARSTGTVNWLAQIEGGYTTGLGITANSNDAAGAYLSLAKSRGATVGSNTIVQANDGLGYILFSGADGSTANTQGGYIGCEVDATPGASKIPGRLVFYTASSGSPSVMLERMRITSDGTIRSANVNGSNIVCINNGATNTALIYFQTSGAELGKIRINGAGVAYDTTSDYRLKENIEPITDAVSRLQALKPWRFNFISHPDVTVDGFLAHEAQEVVPEAVGGHKDEEDADGNPIYQGIDQSKLVPLLTAALQEAIAKIESLEARLSAAGI